MLARLNYLSFKQVCILESGAGWVCGIRLGIAEGEYDIVHGRNLDHRVVAHDFKGQKFTRDQCVRVVGCGAGQVIYIVFVLIP